MRKFEFSKKSYEDIDVHGRVFRLHLDDDSIAKQQKQINEYYKITNDIKTDLEQLEVEKQHEFIDEIKGMTKELLNTFFDENDAFDFLYEESGRSMYNLTEIVEVIGEIIMERYEDLEERKGQSYLQKKTKEFVQ
ncbi:hypothetical protein [Oceanobacillus kimchii]|uniref:hypothetical protein n=1 Tax=Oceanobacillus kimchii TaxID=746691 RepID=UPI003C73797A